MLRVVFGYIKIIKTNVCKINIRSQAIVLIFADYLDKQDFEFTKTDLKIGFVYKL